MGGEDAGRVGGGVRGGTHGEDLGDVVDVAPGAVAVGIDTASFGHPEVPAAGAVSRGGTDPQSTLVDQGVVAPAKQDQVVEIGGTAV